MGGCAFTEATEEKKTLYSNGLMFVEHFLLTDCLIAVACIIYTVYGVNKKGNPGQEQHLMFQSFRYIVFM